MVSARANPAQRVCLAVWSVLRAVWRAMDEVAQRVVGRCVLTTIPTHLAFVMDGNRRFATAAGLQQVEGHKAGASTLVEALEWCLGLGVRVVSVYAFSLENFKRSPEEVSGRTDQPSPTTPRDGSVSTCTGRITTETRCVRRACHPEPPPPEPPAANLTHIRSYVAEALALQHGYALRDGLRRTAL